jgi:hypothetical protein
MSVLFLLFAGWGIAAAAIAAAEPLAPCFSKEATSGSGML